MSLDVSKLVEKVIPDKEEELEEFLQNPPDNLENTEVYNEYCRKLSEIGKFEPRPDLKKDTEYWQNLLKKAYNLDNQVYNLLHFLRCSGTQLKDDNGSLRMVPAEDFKEWNKYRKEYLLPIKDIIKDLLNKANSK